MLISIIPNQEEVLCKLYIGACICVCVYMCISVHVCLSMCVHVSYVWGELTYEPWKFEVLLHQCLPRRRGGYFAILCLPDAKLQSMPGPRALACTSILLLLEPTIGFGVFCKVLELHRNVFWKHVFLQ